MPDIATNTISNEIRTWKLATKDRKKYKKQDQKSDRIFLVVRL